MNGEAQAVTWATIALDFLKTILPVVVTAVATYIIARYNTQNPKHRAILEEQLQKVFSPIQLIYRFENYKNAGKLNEIESILKDNFLLVPTPIIDAWKNDEMDIIDFCHFNEACFEYARKELGYQHRKIDRERKRVEARWDRVARLTLSTRFAFFDRFFDQVSTALCGFILAIWLIAMTGEENNPFIAFYKEYTITIYICFYILLALPIAIKCIPIVAKRIGRKRRRRRKKYN